MATVKFYLRAKQNGEASIQLKFTVDRNNRFALATGERVLPKYWNSVKQEVKSNYPGHLELNQSLNRIKNDIIQLWRDNKTSNLDAFQEMARHLVKFGSLQTFEKKSLLTTLKEFIDQSAREKAEGTVKKYQGLYGKLEGFNPALPISGLDMKFYDAFKNHLSDQGLFDAVIYKYLSNLSAFLTWAKKRGHDVHMTGEAPTHKQWEIIRRHHDPLTLTLAELEALENLEITEELIEAKLGLDQDSGHRQRTIQSLALARDYFIIECRTCQRISDVKRFNLKDVEGSVWTNTVQKGRRLKTTKVRIPFNTTFTAPAWEILRKHNFELPKISEQKLNKAIKKVCRLAGIDKPVTIYRWKQNQEVAITKDKCDFITTHTGRRTFITIGLQFLVPKLVKQLAGISWDTLKHYEGDAEDETIINGLNSIPIKTPLLKIAQ